MKKRYEKLSDIIEIGGIPYLRRCEYNGWAALILGYDINTEKHLIIKNIFDEQKRIELDNDKLILTEAKN